MSRLCKNCGAENRDNAQFCSGCGVPLPKAKTLDEKKLKELEAKTRRFWNAFFAWTAAAAVAAGFLLNMVSTRAKVDTAKKFENAYLFSDRSVFSGITNRAFVLEGVSWGMTGADVAKIYPAVKPENDPDFRNTLMAIPPFNPPLPHANFMNLGMYLDKLYAVKFEFGEMAESSRQMLKVANKEFVMYGRYMGLVKIFRELFGEPAAITDPARALPLAKKVEAIRRGSLNSGAPSNIFIYWLLGDTRVEIALFGYKGEIKLTARFFYIPVYNKLENSGIKGGVRVNTLPVLPGVR